MKVSQFLKLIIPDYESFRTQTRTRQCTRSLWGGSQRTSRKKTSRLLPPVNQVFRAQPCCLQDHFETFGTVTDVYIPVPFRHFCFVQFSEFKVAQSLLGKEHSIKVWKSFYSRKYWPVKKYDEESVESTSGRPSPHDVTHFLHRNYDRAIRI